MFDWLQPYLPPANSIAYYLLRGTITFLVIAVAARTISIIIRRAFLSNAQLLRHNLSERRRTTLRALVSSLTNGLAILISLFLILGMFVQPSALFTFLGLFSAGLGFSARPYVSDFLGGITLLFEDQFALGDKVEIGDRQVVGCVERISLRMTYIRGESGELWLVPNGDIRTIRNFTRGKWSPASIKLTVPTTKLDETMVVLHQIISNPGDDVIETPEIISEDGEIGAVTTTITLKVKARYSMAPAVRERLITQLQAALTEHHVLAADENRE